MREKNAGFIYWKTLFRKSIAEAELFSGNFSQSFLSLENSSKMDFKSRLSMATTQLIAHLQAEFHIFIGNSDCGKRNIIGRITCQINFSLESVNT